MTRQETEQRKSQLGWLAMASFAAALLSFVFTRLSGSSAGFYAAAVFLPLGCIILSRWDGKKQSLRKMDTAAEKDRELEERRAILSEPQYEKLVRRITSLDSGDAIVAFDAAAEREYMWIVTEPGKEGDDVLWAQEVTGHGEDCPWISDVIRMKDVEVIPTKSSVFVSLYQSFWQRQHYDPRRDGGGIQDP